MSAAQNFSYAEKRNFWSRFGFAIGLGAVGIIVVVLFRQMLTGHAGPRQHRAPDVVMIRPVTPTTPPTPPPPQQVIQKQQVSEQTLVNDQQISPEEQAPEEPAASLGTNIRGNGPDAFGLGRRDTGIFSGQGGEGGQGSGNRFGLYFVQVKDVLSQALRENVLTRTANFNIRVRIWADLTGRITRAKLVGSSGDTAIDQAIRNNVLVGRQLPDTPEGMQMPIELRLSARKPN